MAYEPLGSKRGVLRSSIVNDRTHYGLREHEIDKAVDIAETLFVGQTNVGQAVRGAAKLIQEGKA